MLTSEKINTSAKNERSNEYERGQGDTLRGVLLSESEAKGGYVTIPRDTVLIEASSATLTPELFSELSNVAEEIQEDTRHHGARTIHEKGYGKLSMGTFMSSIDYGVRHDLKKDELSSNLTLLYDGRHTDVDGETKVPSAVLVHEALSDEQIKKLRDRLPAGVPLLDAGTNRLLDEVGLAEREKGRREMRVKRGLGDFVLHNFGQLDSHREEAFRSVFSTASYDFIQPVITHNTDEYSSPRSAPSGSGNERTENGRTRRARPTPTASTASKEATRPYRERVSVEQAERDAHEENQGRNIQKATGAILNEAKERYGASDLSGLDDTQLRKVERGVQAKLHPDRGYQNGGDQGAFQEAGVLMNKFRDVKEAMKGAASESSSPPKEASADTSSASESKTES